MSTLLGWFDSPVAGMPPEGAAAVMARARAFDDAPRRLVRTGPSFGLAAQGAERDTALASSDAISVAVAGRPRWEDDALAALAAREGHAAAALEGYRRHGEGFLPWLKGSFSLAVVDGAARRVVIAVDRFGVHTMCYSQPRRGGLVFGTSTDVVCAHPAVESTVSDQTVFNYLYFGICPSPQTIYREQSKLLPAQYLVYERGMIRTGFYWRMPYGTGVEKDVPTLSAEVMQRLRRAVERNIGDEDPAHVGAFLSGGLDSSTVAGLLSEAVAGRAKTFTIGFEHAEYDEIHYAEVAARHFGTEQHNYYLRPSDVVDVLADLSRAFDEPFGNSSVVPAYYCAKAARERGTHLLLAGDGGDEIFAGNSRYIDQEIFGLYGRLPRLLRSALIEPVASRLPIARRVQSYIRRANTPMPDRLETYNFYQNADLAQVFEPAMMARIDPVEPLRNLREAYERTQSEEMLQRMLHLDLKITLADNDLRKVETACRMAGVGVAYPFLDDDVAEFAAHLPGSLLIRGRKRRWFFKKAVEDFLAPETLAKRKHGFGMPFVEWPREDPALRRIAVDCVAGFKRRGYLRPDFLDRLMGERGDGSHDGLVWDVMMLELWFREREERVRQKPALGGALDGPALVRS